MTYTCIRRLKFLLGWLSWMMRISYGIIQVQHAFRWNKNGREEKIAGIYRISTFGPVSLHFYRETKWTLLSAVQREGLSRWVEKNRINFSDTHARWMSNLHLHICLFTLTLFFIFEKMKTLSFQNVHNPLPSLQFNSESLCCSANCAVIMSLWTWLGKVGYYQTL